MVVQFDSLFFSTLNFRSIVDRYSFLHAWFRRRNPYCPSFNFTFWSRYSPSYRNKSLHNLLHVYILLHRVFNPKKSRLLAMYNPRFMHHPWGYTRGLLYKLYRLCQTHNCFWSNSDYCSNTILNERKN